MEFFRNKLGLLKQRGSAVEREFRSRLSGYVLAALGLVAGLAWNDAIKAAIEYFFPFNAQGLTAKFIYAVVVTIVIVIITVVLLRLIQIQEEDKKK
jgi:hypothetical protein